MCMSCLRSSGAGSGDESGYPSFRCAGDYAFNREAGSDGDESKVVSKDLQPAELVAVQQPFVQSRIRKPTSCWTRAKNLFHFVAVRSYLTIIIGALLYFLSVQMEAMQQQLA